MHNDQTLSSFTKETIGKLSEKGMLFSYATARSYTTASKVTAGLPDRLPVIVFNGSFIIETGTEKRLLSCIFSQKEASEILDQLLQCQVYPIVNAFLGGIEKFSYCEGKESRGVIWFLNARQHDTRKNPVFSAENLYQGEIFHITCIDEEEKLRPLYEYFRDKFPCVFYRDMYSGEMWFEIHPKGATKADAVLSLKKMLGCEKVVCFGDGKNDISMFRVADECYAVKNADEELLRVATAVIDSNENDGVAKWLMSHCDALEA